MSKYTPLAFEINLPTNDSNGFVIEVGSLFEALCRLQDQRDARGLRYALVTVLVFTVLAKLAGENQLRGIAQWVRRRAVLLASFLMLANVQAPHATTYSRILSKAIAIEEFEQVSRDFFCPTTPRRNERSNYVGWQNHARDYPGRTHARHSFAGGLFAGRRLGDDASRSWEQGKRNSGGRAHPETI